MRTIVPAVAFLLSALLLVHPPPAVGQCTPEWQPGEGEPAPVVALASDGDAIVEACVDDRTGISEVYRIKGAMRTQLGPKFRGEIRALLADGDGIVAAGNFSWSGSNRRANIARWDGSAWRPLGGGLPNHVRAIARHQGSLLAATYGPSSGAVVIVRWDGSTWRSFAPELTGLVNCLLSWNDALYAGGSFVINDTTVSRVVRLGPSGWEPVGQPLSHVVLALAPHNNELVAGGYFNIGTGRGIARFDGVAWQPLGTGPGTAVRAIAAVGADLYAAGDFSRPSKIARWSGGAWLPLDKGLYGAFGSALLFHHGTLYVGGDFTLAGSQPSAYLARYACACYANCDGSAATPALNINDFICFTNHFLAAGSLPTEQQVGDYANCDSSTEPPILTIADFVCFQQVFAGGCQ